MNTDNQSKEHASFSGKSKKNISWSQHKKKISSEISFVFVELKRKKKEKTSIGQAKVKGSTNRSQ